MSITLIDSQNDNHNLGVGSTVGTFAGLSGPTWCQLLMHVGDGTDDPIATAGMWQLYMMFRLPPADPYWTPEPAPQLIWAGTAQQKYFTSKPFIVLDGYTVIAVLTSPNAEDDDIDVTSYLFDISTGKALNVAIPDSPTANSINERIKTMDDAYTATRAPYLDELHADNLPTDVDAILADTNALPDAGALTTLQAAADAIKAVTDAMPDAGALTALQAAADAIQAAATEARLAELDAANLPADIDTILADVTADEGHSTKVDTHSTKLG